MFEEKHSVIIMAAAVTVLALAGVYVTFSQPTITGSVGVINTGIVGPVYLEEYRLVKIEPRVGEAHNFIVSTPEIEIQEEFGATYIALVPLRLIPQLMTMADVEFANS